jgi:hypothetical protein
MTTIIVKVFDLVKLLSKQDRINEQGGNIFQIENLRAGW